MLNINNVLNFKNYVATTRKTNTNATINSFNAPKLKPLTQDTISFSGVAEYKAAIDNKTVCEQLHEDAKEAKNYLENIIIKGFGHLVQSKDNPDGIIEPIKGRVKSKESIEEKISNRIQKALRSPNVKGDIFSPYNTRDIKKNIRDIPGARIVINNAHDNHMDTIVDNLCKTIIQEDLVIDQIENHYSDSKDIEKYFTDEQLKKIQNAINKVRELNSLEPIEVINTATKTGYMALHLDVDLTDIGTRKQNRGFHGELQILGSDVSMLKDIEDFCYKLKQGMGIKAQHSAYTPFERFFLEAYNNTEKYPNVKEDFEKYTKQAYQIQRKRKSNGDATDNISDWSYRYPTIKECGLEDKIPPLLDFNVLARIKRDCDDLFYVYNHPERIIQEATTPKK